MGKLQGLTKGVRWGKISEYRYRTFCIGCIFLVVNIGLCILLLGTPTLGVQPIEKLQKGYAFSVLLRRVPTSRTISQYQGLTFATLTLWNSALYSTRIDGMDIKIE